MVLSTLNLKAVCGCIASILLVVLSILNLKVFNSYITNRLPLGVGVGFLFGGIIEKLNWLSS